MTEANKRAVSSPADRSFRSGDWQLDIYFRLPGTKSEGQHGELLHRGEPVLAQQVGETIETDLGMLKYYCRPEELVLPWEHTGWNFADAVRIRPSWHREAQEGGPTQGG